VSGDDSAFDRADTRPSTIDDRPAFGDFADRVQQLIDIAHSLLE
jgi:hypothetical protein